MLRNQKLQITNIFGKVAEERNEGTAADGRKSRITHSKVRNKFKKLVCKYKSVPSWPLLHPP